jgi:hypothetical protein
MSENKHLTPVWIVYVDGKRLDIAHEGALRRITIAECLNDTSVFSILFDSSEVKVQEEGLIHLDSEVSVHLGYKDDVDEVFRGEVTGFKGAFPEHGTEQVEVSGVNVLHRLSHAAHFRNFEGKSPAEIIRGLIDGYSLKAETEDFGAAQDFLSEDGWTDYDYLMKSAFAYGKQVFASGSTIYVANEITLHNDEIIYEWGKSLIRFEGFLNTGELLTSVDCIGWDHLKNESFTGHAGLSDLPLKIGGSTDWTKVSQGGNGKYAESCINTRLKDINEAKQLAIGTLQQNSFRFCRAEGSGEGNHKLHPGMRVSVKMAGQPFEGEYMADTVTHHIDHHSGYSTQFTLKRNMLP